MGGKGNVVMYFFCSWDVVLGRMIYCICNEVNIFVVNVMNLFVFVFLLVNIMEKEILND